MKDGITVIIPCYNVANYLDNCLKSIFEQTYDKLEIILIDDCSTDDTVKVMKKLAKKDKRIKLLFNDKNGGAGYSRNIALKEATYKYISFIDSDDCIPNDYYEKLLGALKESKADIAVCDIFVRYQNQEIADIRSCACENGLDRLSFINNGLAASPCNKLFHKKLLDKFPFSEGIMTEDIPTVIACLYNAKKIAYTDEVYYNYIQRKGSVQNDNLSEKRFDVFKAISILEDRIGPYSNKDEIWNAIIYNQIIMFFIYVIPKEKSYFKRAKFLKKFYQLSKKYEIRKNHLLWDFLAIQGPKHNFYYRLILKLNCNGLSYTSSFFISLYKIYLKLMKKSVIEKNLDMRKLIDVCKKQARLTEPSIRISVIVPNYNYEEFLYQRIYSILNQKIKLYELIILDDCSKDNSKEVIDDIVEKLSPYVNIKKVYNDANSGSAFKQWKKGFDLASGDYVWIAEADDYSDCKFLKKITQPLLDNPEIVISYCDTSFVDKAGFITSRSVKNEIDLLKTGHWDTSFINDGNKEINDYAFLNCTIANVSSVVFKKNDYSSFFELSGKYKQAGDWLFYLNVMSTGKIAYCSKPYNYYRVHGNNVTSITKKQIHYDEICSIYEFLNKKYCFSKEQKECIQNRLDFLKKAWKLK